MRITRYTFDPVSAIVGILAVLLMIGVLPFSRKWVGILALLSNTELKFTWER